MSILEWIELLLNGRCVEDTSAVAVIVGRTMPPSALGALVDMTGSVESVEAELDAWEAQLEARRASKAGGHHAMS